MFEFYELSEHCKNLSKLALFVIIDKLSQLKGRNFYIKCKQK